MCWIICDCLSRSISIWPFKFALKGLRQGGCLAIWIRVVSANGQHWQRTNRLVEREVRAIMLVPTSCEVIFTAVFPTWITVPTWESTTEVPNFIYCFFPVPPQVGVGGDGEVIIAPQCCHSLVYIFNPSHIFINSSFVKLFNSLFEYGIYFMQGTCVICNVHSLIYLLNSHYMCVICVF